MYLSSSALWVLRMDKSVRLDATCAHAHDEMYGICRLSSVLVGSLLVADTRLDPTSSFTSKVAYQQVASKNPVQK